MNRIEMVSLDQTVLPNHRYRRFLKGFVADLKNCIPKGDIPETINLWRL